MGESVMEQQEFWRSLAPLAEATAFFLGTDIALEMLQRGDRRDVDHFFRSHIGREATPHELLAVFRILTRPSKRWRMVKWPATLRYLGKATWAEGLNIRREWKRDGMLPPKRRKREALAADEYYRNLTHVVPPDRQLEREEASEFRAQVMERVYSRIRETGTERDRMILDLLVRGRSPAQSISELGLKMSAWEALRGKMERWGRKEMKILWSEMSSRRVSAA